MKGKITLKILEQDWETFTNKYARDKYKKEFPNDDFIFTMIKQNKKNE